MRPDIAAFRRLFLTPESQRHAVMLTLEAAQQRDRKYDERQGCLSDAQITGHLAGEVTLAAPAAVDGLAALLPLDVDAGGRAAICALIAAATRRGLWAFGQYCPRMQLPPEAQHGYVWLVFASPSPAAQLQALGRALVAEVQQDGWKIETRAHAATTRLPFARHTHTRQFGELITARWSCPIDQCPPAVFQALLSVLQVNPTAALPPLPPPPLPAEPAPGSGSLPGGSVIQRYNQTHDLVALLEGYGARWARGSRRLLYCCGHPDARRASLLLWHDGQGQLRCRCLSQHHQCPLAEQMRDPFGVYCAMEGLTPADALRRLRAAGEI